MKIKKIVYEDVTWQQVKEAAMSQDAVERLPLRSEIAVDLGDGRIATVVVAAHIPATENNPAGIRFVFKDCIGRPYRTSERPQRQNNYRTSDVRIYLLGEVYQLLPAELRAIIRPRKIIEIYKEDKQEYEDMLWLLSETDVFGRGESTWQFGRADGPDDFQLPIFRNALDRVRRDSMGDPVPWSLRSVDMEDNCGICIVNSGGGASAGYATDLYDIFPGFDI